MVGAKEAYKDYYVGQENAIGGNDRFSWVSDFFLNGVSGKNILDVGCGEGSLLKILKDKGNSVSGIEASETGQQACKKKRIECFSVDISRERFPFEDEAFDIVTCLEVIEHVENPYQALCEIKRVLKPGGKLIISIPNPRSMHAYIYPGLFDFEAFQQFLQQGGFFVQQRKGWGQTGMFNAWRCKLSGSKSSLGRLVAQFIYYLNRKRNAFFRNYLGTPEMYCHCLSYICIKTGNDVDQLVAVAKETKPVKG